MWIFKSKRVMALERELERRERDCLVLEKVSRDCEASNKELIFKNEILDAEKKALAEENEALRGQIAELSKKTVSDMTTKEDEPPTAAQILDEYLNGEEGEE